jgi:hypothetical protein
MISEFGSRFELKSINQVEGEHLMSIEEMNDFKLIEDTAQVSTISHEASELTSEENEKHKTGKNNEQSSSSSSSSSSSNSSD